MALYNAIIMEDLLKLSKIKRVHNATIMEATTSDISETYKQFKPRKTPLERVWQNKE